MERLKLGLDQSIKNFTLSARVSKIQFRESVHGNFFLFEKPETHFVHLHSLHLNHLHISPSPNSYFSQKLHSNPNFYLVFTLGLCFGLFIPFPSHKFKKFTSPYFITSFPLPLNFLKNLGNPKLILTSHS